MRRPLLILAVVAGGALAWLGLRQMWRGHYEQPDYRLVDRLEDWEIREYAPTLQARVTVEAPYDQAVREGFRILAGYIFGDNAPGDEIAMTSPVSATSEAEGWTVAFTMPARYTRDTLPEPVDPRIHIIEVPTRRVAVRRFPGYAGPDRIEREIDALEDDLDQRGLADIAGPPIVAQYDPPVVPGFLRRNEIQVPLGSG